MYHDHSPIPHCRSGDRVLVIEKGDEEAPSTVDADGDTVYWIIFAEEPRRVWDCTEAALRSSLEKR